MKAEKKDILRYMDKHKVKIGLIAAILLLMFVFKVSIITTCVLSIAAGYIQYLFSKYQLKMDPGHIFFLGILLASTASGLTALFFVILAGIVPKVIGADMDPIIVVAYLVQAVAVFIASFIAVEIVTLGVIFSILTFGLIFIVTVIIEDFNVIEVIDDTLIPL
ncbi:MAG: hypothetical protein NDI94_04685, partial [Candidatus Woesearchaeota archaeon]|nr:hypothetical protein [Candidatus Woesearchaeota archaeon]